LSSSNTASTAFHGQDLGFRTALIDDCSRGIQSEGMKSTIEKVKSNHGVVIQSSEVRDPANISRH
jgi:nicotinamidase-related amidase